MADPPPGQGDRDFFVDQMKTALGVASIRLTNGQPSADDLRAYFRTLAGDPFKSWAKYNEYAKAFYVHIDMLPDTTPAINWRPAQIRVSLGLKTCDAWSQIVSRTRMGDGSNRRIIDCRGFSFIAADLLGAADWEVKGFRTFFVPRRRDIPWHVAVELRWTKTAGFNDMLVGTQEASNGGFPDEKKKGYTKHPDVISAVQVTDPPSATQAQAFQKALDLYPEPGDPALASVGTFPARQPAGSFPPRSVSGRSWA